MQFGIFSVSDITADPTTGRTPTEGERIKAVLAIAQKAEEVGLDVFALGEHHNPPFFSSSPTTTLAHIAARTTTLQLSTATTLITTNDPVKIAEDYAMLQHLADGRVDLMLGRGNTGPVYPWFGKDIREGIELAVENYALLRRLWRGGGGGWGGEVRTPPPGLTPPPPPPGGRPPPPWPGPVPHPRHPAPAGRRPALRLARFDPQPADRRAGRLLRRRVLLQPHLLAGRAHRPDGRVLPPPVRALRPRRRRPGDRRPGRAGVHAEEQPGRGERVPPVLRQRPGLRPRPLAGGVHDRDAADRGQPAAGDRAHPGLPRLRRGLPAAAVPPRPRRPAAEDRPGAAGPARRGGRAGAAPGVRRPQARARARRPDPRLAGRRGRRGEGRHRPRSGRRRHRSDAWRGRRGGGGPMSSTRTLAVVSAGLSVPSSTRLLADRLSTATVDALHERGDDATVEVLELRQHARDL